MMNADQRVLEARSRVALVESRNRTLQKQLDEVKAEQQAEARIMKRIGRRAAWIAKMTGYTKEIEHEQTRND